MHFTVRLKPIKQIFFNPSNGFRVLSCDWVSGDEVILNQYDNFTLSGSNLSMLDMNQEYELEIKEDTNNKYKGSYIVVGYTGVTVTQTGITIKPEQEMLILKHICSGKQAEYIHDAYPNFVQLVLDGKEKEIDYKKIYNVDKIRFNIYVNNIRDYLKQIRYIPVTADWNIESDKDINILVKAFATPEDLNKQLQTNPYQVFFDLLHYPFVKSDKFVLRHDNKWIDSKERCEYACLEILRRNEEEGDTRLYTDLLEDMAAELVPEASQYVKECAKNSERIYYDSIQEFSSNKATYEVEVNISHNIKERAKNEKNLNLNIDKFGVVDGFECTDEQKQILDLANRYQICMLRGYAGSGKSTVMKALVLALEDKCIDYVQLAPTGKAAKRLRETTGRPASTIHMYLTYNGGFQPKVIIIDEMSMVGVKLLSTLFNAVGKDTRFVFVCDEAQLASISCGNVVQDIIDSGIMPTASLTKIFRYGTNGLVTIATDTRQGKLGIRENNSFSDYQFIPIDNDPITQVLETYEFLLDKYTKDDIMILSPFNKGSAGTVAINNAIQSRFNPNPDTNAIRKVEAGEQIMFKTGDKVINTHNEYNMPSFEYDDNGDLIYSDKKIMVMNGDIGYVRYIKETDKGVIMAIEFDTGIAHVDSGYMNNFLLGYAISCHKSQGSEAKAVIVLTSPRHRRMLTSNLLYVADSRAKEQLIEIGDIETIKEGLKRKENKERETWLKELLKEA